MLPSGQYPMVRLTLVGAAVLVLFFGSACGSEQRTAAVFYGSPTSSLSKLADDFTPQVREDTGAEAMAWDASSPDRVVFVWSDTPNEAQVKAARQFVAKRASVKCSVLTTDVDDEGWVAKDVPAARELRQAGCGT